MGFGASAMGLAKKALSREGTLGKVGKMSVVGVGIDTGMNLMAGDNLGTSVMKAGVTGAVFASNPILAPALMAGSMATDAAWGLQKFNMQKQSWWNAQYATNNTVGGNYMDTQRAMTMRQAAVQSIQGSKLNARSALGGEAKILSPYSMRR